MNDTWLTTGFRVSWLQSHPFAGEPPTRHEQTVATAAEALDLVGKVMRAKPFGGLPTHSPEVVELQERLERRERTVGISWKRDR